MKYKIEPIAASAQPITNVMLITLLIFTPISCAVSKSFDTALIAIPILVLLISATSAITSTIVKIGVMNVTSEVEIVPIVIFLSSTAIEGYDFGSAEKRYVAKFCRKYETPIAEIIIDILGALRSGLYAIFSVKTPKRIVATITIAIEICHVIKRSVIAIIIK